MTQAPTLSYAKHILATMALAWPVIAGQLGHILIGQVDNIMIGDLGSTQLAAASLANGIFYLVMVFGFGICTAISPITSKALGAKHSEEQKSDILMQGFRIIFVVSLLIIAAIYGLMLVLPHLGQSPQVVILSRPYLVLIGWSTLPMLLFLVIKHFIDGFEKTIPGMLLMSIMVVLNILLNWILIYGKWGAPALGLNGAGWATLLSRTMGLVFFVVYLMLHPRFKKYFKVRGLFKRSKAVYKNILEVGIPSGLQYLFEIGAFSGAVILAGRLGENEQSAHQIAISIAALTYMFYMGISVAASIRIGNAYGRNDPVFIQRAGFAALMSSLAFIILFILLMLGFRSFLSEFYIDDLAVQEIVFGLLVIAAIFQIFDGAQAVIQGMLRGIEDVKVPSFLAFTAYWLIGLPAAYLFSEVLGWGISGIWWALTLGLSFSALLLSLRFVRMTRRMRFQTQDP